MFHIRKTGIVRSCTIILAMMMVFTLLPWNWMEVRAAATLSDPRVNGSVVQWDCVYFGNYPQSDATGKNKEPIKWRVIKVRSNSMCLVADQKLDVQPYHSKDISVAYVNSNLKAWLNTTFINQAFTASEREAIFDDPNGQVQIPGRVEVSDAGLGYVNDASRVVKNTNYTMQKLKARAPSYSISPDKVDSYYGAYWVRDTSRGDGTIMVVRGYGQLDSTYKVTSTMICVRPMLHLKTESSHWRYAGKLMSNGAAAPTVPGDFKATRTDFNSANLTWNMVNEADGYELYRNDVKLTTLEDRNKTSFKDTNLRLKTTYQYKLRAYWNDENGKSYGSFTPVASVSVPNVPVPGSFKAARADFNSASLKWNVVREADGYELYRNNKKIKAFDDRNITSFKDANLALKATYQYKLRAYWNDENGKSYGNFTPVASVSVPNLSAPQITPKYPKKVRGSRIQLRWKDVTGASGYQVQATFKTKKKGKTIQKKLLAHTKDDYKTLKPVKNRKYTLKVRAYRNIKDSNGKVKKQYGPWSKSKSIKIKK